MSPKISELTERRARGISQSSDYPSAAVRTRPTVRRRDSVLSLRRVPPLLVSPIVSGRPWEQLVDLMKTFDMLVSLAGSHPDSGPPTINAKPATLPWLPPRWRQTPMRVAGVRRVHFVLICFWCWSSSARLKCSSCGVGALAVGPRTFRLGACAVPCAPPTSSQRETTEQFCPGASLRPFSYGERGTHLDP